MFAAAGAVRAKHGPAHARLMLGLGFTASALHCKQHFLRLQTRAQTLPHLASQNTGHIHTDAGGGASSKHTMQKLYNFYHQKVELVTSE